MAFNRRIEGLSKFFFMKDLGVVKRILGIKITKNCLGITHSFIQIYPNEFTYKFISYVITYAIICYVNLFLYNYFRLYWKKYSKIVTLNRRIDEVFFFMKDLGVVKRILERLLKSL